MPLLSKDNIETKSAAAEVSCMAAKVRSVAGAAPAPVRTPPLDYELRGEAVEIPVRLCNLPPLNAIVHQILALSANPDVDLQQIAAVMEGDPAFAADVLFLANSSLFGFRSRIQVVRHAIAVLGLERIKAIAVTAAMRSYLSRGGPFVPRCWQHSVASAIVAEEISPALHVKGDVAYTLALLHDIGRMGLLRSYPAEYPPILKGPFEGVEEVLQVERALLKVDHSLAGAWMVRSWGFPNVFVKTCQHHHEPIAASDTGLLQAVKISCLLADAIGYSTVNYKNSPSYDDSIQAFPPHLAHKQFPSREELRVNVETRLKSFN